MVQNHPLPTGPSLPRNSANIPTALPGTPQASASWRRRLSKSASPPILPPGVNSSPPEFLTKKQGPKAAFNCKSSPANPLTPPASFPQQQQLQPAKAHGQIQTSR